MAKKKEVEIDFRKTVQENAEKYFEEAKWAKSKIEATKKALEKTRRQVRKLKKGLKKKEPKKAPRKRRRGKWFEKFRWMITSDGFLVIGGRDATQNEMLFKKHLQEGDIVLHAEISGAPLTIIKSEGKPVTPLAVREAGEFAISYSSAWKQGLGSMRAFFAKHDEVSKKAPAGEYLPKGSFMFHKRNYLKKMEIKIAIGIMFQKDKEGKRIAKPICGAVQAVNKNAEYFVTLKPGDISQAELAKQIKKKILIKAMPEDVPLIEEIPLEDIQKLIPPGGGYIFGGG
ncbi:MAG: NFACT RNA binding domain-containing protein [Candidatus Aenigmatarchaeota archaeon]